MGNDPEITVSQLRVAIGRILDAVEGELGEELRLPIDYYWDVMAKDAHRIARGDYRQPKPTLGQVSDDAASLREFLARPTGEYVPIQAEGARFRGLLLAIEHVYLNQGLLRDPNPDDQAHDVPPRLRRRWWDLRPEGH